MTEIIGVKFKSGGKQYYFAPNGLTVKAGQGVIVETSKGLEYGVCSRPNGFVEDTTVVQPLRPLIRVATPADEQTVANNAIKEKQALALCREKVEKYELDMKLVDVEYAFDGSKVLFFFTSDGRVDFRALVKDLAAALHTRIELRQIGVRDEARMLGGIGICGKPFCCSQFLNEFVPVSIKMAKTQNLSLNPTKISGSCGRLMCCLKYEQDAYEDAVRRCPKNDSFVECPDGVGNITAVNLLREQVRVRLEDASDPMKTYRVDEIRVVRSGKGKRPDDYVAPPAEELEKLRYVAPAEETARPRTSSDRLAAALESILAHNAAPAEETPKASAETPSAEEKDAAASGRSRRRRGRGGKKPAEGAAQVTVQPQEKPAAPKTEKQTTPKTEKQAQQPAGEVKKSPSRRRRGARRRSRGSATSRPPSSGAGLRGRRSRRRSPRRADARLRARPCGPPTRRAGWTRGPRGRCSRATGAARRARRGSAGRRAAPRDGRRRTPGPGRTTGPSRARST